MAASLFLVLLLCIATLFLPFTDADVALDMQSLLAFKRRIAHDPFEVLHNWHQNSPNACNWTGVSCSSKHPGRVIGLQHFNCSLGGVIAPQIGNLSFLHSLDLSTNNFTGGIPPSIGGLYRLQFLNVSENNYLGGVIPSELGHLYNLRRFIAFYNDFVGTIPPTLANCSQLQVLILLGNKLSGSIPDTFGSLAHLATVNIGKNTLVGFIPASLFNCSKLQYLNLYSDRLYGSIPHNIGSLPNLYTLNLAVNSLGGSIPNSINNITTLKHVEFSGNHFHGPLPAFLGSVSKLVGLYVWNNSFTGTIPSSWCNATSLAELKLFRNGLHGTIPLCLAALPNLQVFDISVNNFVSGLTNINRPIPILEALSNSSKLSELNMGGNNFHGTLPITLPTHLTAFGFEANFVIGKIPVTIGNLSSLLSLRLGDNSLEGSIPKEISLLNRSLNYMFLNDNKFTGSIPAHLKELTSLRNLDLSVNSFSGPIPKQLGECSNLEHLDLSSNDLSGEIPPEVGNLRNIQTTFSLSHNMLSGTVKGLELPMAEHIDLSHNQLSGEITLYLAGWLNSKFIHLSFNNFSGVLLESVGAKLSLLQSIDLSGNNFAGAITQSMYNLSELRLLNFSFNNFEGNVSCSGAFRNLSRQSFLHNPLLCGKCFNLTECTSKIKRSSTSSKKHIILIVSLAIVAVTSVICFAIFSFLFTKKLKKNVRESLLEMNLFMNILEVEIAQATHNFSANYLLGQGNHGSVYVRALKGGDPVAIKVFSETQHRRGFLKECQTLGRVRHKNLMKIITVCCTENLKAIVIPLMPKGNLHNLLHEKDAYGQLSTPSLQIRAKLLQELTAGLSYLHHYCTPQIVHCDVKPENVLLDYDFSVKLADFRIAKLLGNSNITETSTLRGSIGYIAPEFGAREASVKGDIYSFGVVMLEVITKVKPTDAMFVDNLNLCNWVATTFQGDANRMQLESVLNVNSGLEIIEEEEWIIVEKILKIGVSACSHFVEERPAMDKIEGMLALLCDAKKEERVGPGNLDAILASSLQPIQQVPESECSSTF